MQWFNCLVCVVYGGDVVALEAESSSSLWALFLGEHVESAIAVNGDGSLFIAR